MALYNPDGSLIKTLTNSSKAYGPVFSRDGKNIFYADNFGDKPILRKIALSGGNPITLYESKVIGAISNISPSPDDKQLIFTFIQQEKPTYPPENEPLSEETYHEAKEDLYLINTDGTNPKIFLKDAHQAAWSPK